MKKNVHGENYYIAKVKDFLYGVFGWCIILTIVATLATTWDNTGKGAKTVYVKSHYRSK